MRRLIFGLCLLAAWIVPPSAMAEDTRFDASGEEAETLVIGSVTDLVFIEPLIREFQRTNPSTAVIYRQMTSLDLYAAVADACEKGEFFADTVISSAIPEQVRLVNDGCSEPFRFSLPPDLPDWASWRNELVGLTYEPAVIVYDREGLKPEEVPRNRFELVDLLRQTERFRGRIGTYDIESSGVGYIFAFEDASQASTWGRRRESRGWECAPSASEALSDGSVSVHAAVAEERPAVALLVDGGEVRIHDEHALFGLAHLPEDLPVRPRDEGDVRRRHEDQDRAGWQAL